MFLTVIIKNIISSYYTFYITFYVLSSVEKGEKWVNPPESMLPYHYGKSLLH